VVNVCNQLGMFAIGFASKRGKILATTFTRVPNSGATRDLTHPYGNEYSIGKETSKDLRMNSDKQEQWSGRLDMARSSVPRTVAKIHPAKKQATGATVFNCTVPPRTLKPHTIIHILIVRQHHEH